MNVKLVMFKSNGQRKDFPINIPVTVIGRGEECDLRVPLLNVSRKQCELHLAGQQLKVKDLGSSNGTYINNKRVNELVLKAGDRLVVGPVVFTVQIDGVPDEITPVKTRGQQMAEAGEDDVVTLEADVIANPGASGSAEAIAMDEQTLGKEDEEFDPISALEALASETKNQPKKKK